MSKSTQSIENIIPTTAPYRMETEEDRNYEECLHTEELRHADWLEKIKVSSAENYKAGTLSLSTVYLSLYCTYKLLPSCAMCSKIKVSSAENYKAGD